MSAPGEAVVAIVPVASAAWTCKFPLSVSVPAPLLMRGNVVEPLIRFTAVAATNVSSLPFRSSQPAGEICTSKPSPI